MAIAIRSVCPFPATLMLSQTLPVTVRDHVKLQAAI